MQPVGTPDERVASAIVTGARSPLATLSIDFDQMKFNSHTIYREFKNKFSSLHLSA